MVNLVERLLDETREEIHRADNKASIVLAGAGVAIGAVLAGLIAGNVSLSGEPWIVWAMVIAGGGALIVGIVYVGAAVFPRLGDPEPGRARYFREIANFRGDLDDLRTALNDEASKTDERTAQQVLTLSILVNTKYELTRIGMGLLAAGFTLEGAAALLSKM